MILLLDNFDSFTYNLVDYFEQIGVECHVVRNNISLSTITVNKYEAMVISPGPETPESSGNLMEILNYYSNKIPILGICLGHQAIGILYGAKIKLAKKPMHGKVSEINHKGGYLFNNVPDNFSGVRYNSLLIEKVKSPLKVVATTDNREIMAITHNKLPIAGLQFHPEAVLTTYGLQILRNWITKNGLVANQ